MIVKVVQEVKGVLEGAVYKNIMTVLLSGKQISMKYILQVS